MIVAVLLHGCRAGSSPAPERSPDQVPGQECSGVTMRACFGDPVVIAGKGEIRGKGDNGWRSEFEGKPAVDAELSRPHFAMADGAGNIYIADKDADAIRRISPDGTISTVPGDYASPNGVWVRRDGTIYVLDLGHSQIVRVDPSGSVSTLFSVASGISVGRGLWVDDNETLAFVASNTQVIKWTPQAGDTVYADGFGSLGNLIVDPDGQLVVTDRVGGRVYRIDRQGAAVAIAGDGSLGGGGDGHPALETSLPGVRAVWFLAEGGYFVGTHESDAVWHVDRTGTIHAFLAGHDVSEVRGLSLDPSGNLIIVDDDHGFVRMLTRTVRLSG
jgi:sugar lactone lactonase YvrE